MATVYSLTEEKIRELLSGVDGVALSQGELNALVSQLKADQETLNANVATLNSDTLPQLRENLAQNDIRVSALNDVTVPDLNANLAQAALDIQNIKTVDLPDLATSLNNEIASAALRPKVYRQPDAPLNPDINNRSLIVGDTWFDEDNNSAQYVWNGVEWSTLQTDVSDFSITARKFLSTKHMIY